MIDLKLKDRLIGMVGNIIYDVLNFNEKEEVISNNSSIYMAMMFIEDAVQEEEVVISYKTIDIICKELFSITDNSEKYNDYLAHKDK